MRKANIQMPQTHAGFCGFFLNIAFNYVPIFAQVAFVNVLLIVIINIKVIQVIHLWMFI